MNETQTSPVPALPEPTMAILATTALQVATAAAYVVGRRGPLIAQAAVAPWSADHAELGRMVPEKVAAFASAATALALGVGLAQQAAAAHATAMVLAYAAGPTPVGFLALLGRTGSYNADSVARAVRTASEVLSPIHLSVTSNASRLAAARS
ncbi:hypothetical protein [Aerophototrophica crusticola]